MIYAQIKRTNLSSIQHPHMYAFWERCDSIWHCFLSMDSLSYEANLFPLFTPCLIFLSPSLSHITVDRVRERAECCVIPDLSEIAMQLNTDTIQHLILCQLWGKKSWRKDLSWKTKRNGAKTRDWKGRRSVNWLVWNCKLWEEGTGLARGILHPSLMGLWNHLLSS